MLKKKLGKYTILKWLGGGRFGDVYLVYDPFMDKKLALKIAKPSSDKDKKAIDEVKILAELIHENIVRFYTVERFENDKIAIITEYIEGKSLREYIKRKAPVDEETALSIMKPIAKALLYAHQKGIIHRDIKPENIMISKDGTIKIVDFGLSLFLSDELTRSIAGTPSYMAPESWKGKFYPESDYFSLGVTFYELLTGKNPFIGDSLDYIKEKIFSFKPKLPKTTSETIKDIISLLLSHSLEERKKGIVFLIEEEVEEEKSYVTEFSIVSDEGVNYPLTEEQKRVVYSNVKNTLLLGGAGTGKTHTLIGKLLWLAFEKKVPGEEIMVLTFTQRNIAEIEKKLLKVSRNLLSKVWIGTFHNLAFRFVNSYLELLGLEEPFTLILPQTQSRVLKKIYREDRRSKYYDYSEIESAITRKRAYGCSLEEEKEKVKTKYDTFVYDIWNRYDEYLKERKAVDYDELLYKFRKLLKETHSGKKIKNYFSSILVDEFQDLTPIQIEILKILGENSIFFTTGDEDQNIYEWRGTQKNIKDVFLKNFPEDSSVFYLTASFRLPPEIIAPAKNLISHNELREEKVVWTVKREGSGNFSIMGFRTKKEQAQKIAGIIKKLSKEKGYSYDDFAILFRMNSSSREFEEAFFKKKLPYYLPYSESFYSRDEIEKVIDFLKAISGSGKSVFFKVLFSGKKGKKRKTFEDEFKTLKFGDEFLLKLKDRIDDKRTIERFEKLYELFYSYESLRPSQVILDAIEYFSFFRKKSTESEEAYYSRIENLDEFLSLARDFEERSEKKSIKAFLNYVKTLRDTKVFNSGEGVKLMTIHSAKGLEFPVVFLVDMVEGVFPFTKRILGKEQLEEERRLCFVAMTRATDELYVTYYISGNYTANVPSRFIKEMIGM